LIDSLNAIQGVTAKADSFDVIGDNMVAYGNVFIRKGDMIIYADKAVYNNTNKIADLSGNVRFTRIVKSRQEIEYWDLRRLEKDPNVKLKVVGTVMDPTGRQKLVVDVIAEVVSWRGDKAIGDMGTGVFQTGSFEGNFGGWTVVADGATRKADGSLVIPDAEISPCPDFVEGHSVYSFKSSLVDAYPSGDTPSNLTHTQYAPNVDTYHFWAYNNIIYVGDVPVFWLPVMYKPPKRDLGFWNFNAGVSSNYGFFIQNTNSWALYDSPDLKVNTTNMLGYYTKRGFGFGNYTDISTAASKTESFIYMINDMDPNYSPPIDSRYYPLNSFRYDFDIKNMTHITDRLDFRGRFNALSDLYFLNDYYQNWFFTDPEPPTYANLSYQFDRLSADLTFRPKINSFAPTVQEFPTLKLTTPRQEIWKNIYYQGQTSIGYYDMQWASFNRSRASYVPPLGNGVDVTGYSSGRLDTVHFAYYPLNLEGFNLIPRAGLRLTGYTNSSSIPISDDQLMDNLSTQAPEANSGATVVNYNNSGGAAGRIIPEFGLTLNTKFSRSWDNAKNAFWNMNGIRHVFQPYVDYTYLQPFGTDRKYLYYFDDIDRIDTQNFMRFGLDNRLQTRRGGWKSSQSYNWASMTNYLDVLFNTDSRIGEPPGTFNNIGDFGNIINITPNEKLNFNLTTIIDGSRLFSGTDIANCLSTVNVGGTWEFADGWSINPNWVYTRNNSTNPTFSMGSMMEQVESGTYFQRSFADSSYLNTNLNFKINDRTSGVITVSRDFYNGYWPNVGLTLIRQLPCNIQLTVNTSLSQNVNTNGVGTYTNASVSVAVQFTPAPVYEISPRESLLPEDALDEPFIY